MFLSFKNAGISKSSSSSWSLLFQDDKGFSSLLSFTKPSELNSSGVSSSKSKFSSPLDGEELSFSVSVEWSEIADNPFSTELVASSIFGELLTSSELLIADPVWLSVSVFNSSSIFSAFAPLVIIELLWLEKLKDWLEKSE